MAIELIQAPKGSALVPAGPLTLPSAFDQNKWAAKWVKKGPQVDAAAEREWIHGTMLNADGWIPWKDEKNRPHTVSLQSGEHILLCRPRDVQDDVNAIAGNVGKERLIAERTGQTTGGVPVDDSGMLGEDRLTKAIGKDNLEEGDIRMNKI